MEKKIKPRGNWNQQAHRQSLRYRGFHVDKEVRVWDSNCKDFRGKPLWQEKKVSKEISVVEEAAKVQRSKNWGVTKHCRGRGGHQDDEAWRKSLEELEVKGNFPTEASLQPNTEIIEEYRIVVYKISLNFNFSAISSQFYLGYIFC